jgi:hypothetical protein
MFPRLSPLPSSWSFKLLDLLMAGCLAATLVSGVLMGALLLTGRTA